MFVKIFADYFTEKVIKVFPTQLRNGQKYVRVAEAPAGKFEFQTNSCGRFGKSVENNSLIMSHEIESDCICDSGQKIILNSNDEMFSRGVC